jgi:hypothetical protein
MARVTKYLLLLAVGALLFGVSGCSTNEPQNAAARPWNAPETWESGLPIDMGQHE